MHRKALVKGVASDFYVLVDFEGICGVVYLLLDPHCRHICISVMGEWEGHGRIAENGKAAALGFKLDALCPGRNIRGQFFGIALCKLA